MPARKHRAGPTLVDVASAAGVSIATASRALNGSNRTVRPALREAVEQAATELGYSPNAQAQAMARGRTDVVGLVVSDIADPYFSTIAAGVTAEAETHRLLVTLCATDRDAQRELDYLAVLRGQRARAAVVVGSRTADRATETRWQQEIAALQEAGVRVVSISQGRLPVDTLVVENRAGASALAAAVVQQGYRSAAVLAGPPALLTAQDRADGFRKAFVAGGGEEPVVVPGAFTRDGGYAAMREVLEGGRDTWPACVFAVNDVMAMGAMAACREEGLSLPDDIAICGFDDIPTLRDVSPSLTTAALPLEEMGRTAMRLALSDPTDQPRRRRVKATVELRDSTPPR